MQPHKVRAYQLKAHVYLFHIHVGHIIRVRKSTGENKDLLCSGKSGITAQIQDFQEKSDDEVDERTSDEYLSDLDD
ncbi:hypothetical protein Tco_0609244 [Tanacetum coccineum]